MKKYPIAEIFTSPQGEGLYSGAMMTFIRLAGCSVGKKLSDDEQLYWSAAIGRELAPAEEREGVHMSALRTLPVIPNYTEKCTTWDSREFLCDTDFRTKEVLTAKDILERLPEGVDRICVTGGEPLNHDLTELCSLAYNVMLDVHVETSGTVPLKKALPNFDASDQIGDSVRGWLWLTVCPKLGCRDDMVEVANEIKFLVDEHFDASKIPLAWKQKSLIYIQPVNYENEINRENLKRCLELQKQYPHWRISSQSHKNWGVR